MLKPLNWKTLLYSYNYKGDEDFLIEVVEEEDTNLNVGIVYNVYLGHKRFSLKKFIMGMTKRDLERMSKKEYSFEKFAESLKYSDFDDEVASFIEEFMADSSFEFVNEKELIASNEDDMIRFMNTKQVNSCITDNTVIFVDDFNMVIDMDALNSCKSDEEQKELIKGKEGSYSTGIDLLEIKSTDNEVIEDDIQKMYFVLKDGTVMNCEDFYQEYGDKSKEEFMQIVDELVADRETLDTFEEDTFEEDTCEDGIFEDNTEVEPDDLRPFAVACNDEPTCIVLATSKDEATKIAKSQAKEDLNDDIDDWEAYELLPYFSDGYKSEFICWVKFPIQTYLEFAK